MYLPDTGYVLISLYDFVKNSLTGTKIFPEMNRAINFTTFCNWSAASTIVSANRPEK